MGAKVIKVEQPGVGDYYRAQIPEGVNLGGGFFENLHAGHQSMTLDLKQPADHAILLKLIKRSDVVIESFRPGTLQRLRLSFASLKKINRKIILCSITGYGQKGPQAKLAGHDLNFLADSGLYSLLDPEGKVIPDFQMVDLAAGYEAALAIVQQLIVPKARRRAVWLDVSMQSAALRMSGIYRNPHGEQVRSPLGGGLPGYGVYPARDGHVALGALEPKFWNKFCQVLGHPEWQMEGFQLQSDPKMIEELRTIFGQKTVSEWEALGREHDLCLTAVRSLDRVDVARPRKVAPKLGQHTAKILRLLD